MLSMLSITSKCYLLIFYLTVVKFLKKSRELEINKKKSREAWKNKSRIVDIGA